ncbi:glutamate--tRNA ligase [candidate division WOR-3 bacterium]|nr:glutamate--tRNA ligase [candidate division WOR-3 bacterium]
MNEVRVRIAPSPTGALHLGLVRTALYNWLFARQQGGRFILRIDDTDAQRNMAEVLQPILDGLRWLGIDWDEGPEVDGPNAPYFQSQRVDGHKAAVASLLESGYAYYDYATTDEIAAERQAAVANKEGVFRYSRRWMAETAADRVRFEAEGRKSVVRLKMPTEGTLVIDDQVRGPVEFEWQREQDHVIQRADGTFLYHLASIVDDHAMGITHIIRAEEHLSNTPRQIFILQSLGVELPRFAHLPFVAEPGSRNKLSKRKIREYMKNRDFSELVARGNKIAAALKLETGLDAFSPVVVDFYRQTGFLPEAIVNYLALLGWALDDKTEHFTREDLVKSFSLERVNKSAASFDPGKLMAFQVRHMLALSVEKRVDLCLPFLEKAGLVAAPDKVAAIVSAAGDRIKVAGDIIDYLDFFTDDDKLTRDTTAFAREMGKYGAAGCLAKFRGVIASAAFEPAALEKCLQDFVAAEGIKVGQIIHVLRLAVTGKTVGFGLYETMAILGRESVLARIDYALREADK